MWSEAAKAEHPERWNGRATRDWSLPDTVYLNPDKVQEQSEKADEQMLSLIHISEPTRRS